MDQDLTYKLIVTKKGEQIPVAATPGLVVSVITPGDPVVKEITLDVTPEEFENLQDLAKTNKVGDDILQNIKD